MQRIISVLVVLAILPPLAAGAATSPRATPRWIVPPLAR